MRTLEVVDSASLSYAGSHGVGLQGYQLVILYKTRVCWYTPKGDLLQERDIPEEMIRDQPAERFLHLGCTETNTLVESCTHVLNIVAGKECLIRKRDDESRGAHTESYLEHVLVELKYLYGVRVYKNKDPIYCVENAFFCHLFNNTVVFISLYAGCTLMARDEKQTPLTLCTFDRDIQGVSVHCCNTCIQVSTDDTRYIYTDGSIRVTPAGLLGAWSVLCGGDVLVHCRAPPEGLFKRLEVYEWSGEYTLSNCIITPLISVWMNSSSHLACTYDDNYSSKIMSYAVKRVCSRDHFPEITRVL